MNYPTNPVEALHGLNGTLSNGHASSSSNGYPSEHYHSAPYPAGGMRQPSQPMHPLAPHQNWVQQNQFTHPGQVQHSQYGPPWSNQMLPQGFPNGMAALPPFFPQQVLHDAFALSVPVSVEDEPILVKALVDSRPKGETYKEALNRLHGTSGHSASLWKDYYLDNRDRLDSAIRAYAAPSGPSGKMAKKPIYKAETSPFSSSVIVSSSPAPSSRSRQSQQPAQSSRAEPSAGRRRTINSMTTHLPVYNEHLPPPNTELRIPEPPSRSPSPPTEVIPHNRGGNKFTPDDRAYFIKFILWRLKGDPTLLRHELIDLLAARVPHHNANSWASYWSNHHDLPDKILASIRVEDNEDGGEDDEEPQQKKKPAVQPKPKYTDPSSESELTEEEEQESDDDNDDVEIPEADESQMGQRGGPFTKGDLGVVSRHVASFPNWRDTSFNDKWTDFAHRFPQRAAKSWNEYYRRNKNTIDKLAKKVRKLNAAEAAARKVAPPPKAAHPPPPQSQPPQPQPTWAAPDHSGPPRAKRKFGAEEDLEDGGVKRLRRQGT
ncbi:hypothetical protein DFH07DRAFT_788477 [Mycena maculata]|uniref:Uncharacterized protein n=1 Tax=Mycena maculata TaxID=230809 RepID=A0AAD7KFK4_9AGAR|nr:hypothetical protein DFH07DRAFT_788477 [Mycena maculata]